LPKLLSTANSRSPARAIDWPGLILLKGRAAVIRSASISDGTRQPSSVRERPFTASRHVVQKPLPDAREAASNKAVWRGAGKGEVDGV
jgi:hypothetical protein